ncbi:MAG: ribonuclease Y [Candidatus Omnitrophica bacterium]|nr:ribonuclease Y [Candidatus Omnitrophota bacterium]
MEVNTLGQAFIFVFAAIVCVIVGFFLNRLLGRQRLDQAHKDAGGIRELAQREAQAIRKEAELQAKDLLLKMRQDFEKETKERREELSGMEKRVLQREENLDKRVDLLEKKEKDMSMRLEALARNEAGFKQRDEELTKVLAQEKERLYTIANLSAQDARQILLARLEEELLNEKAVRLRHINEEIKETSEKKAREIISTAIQRCASDHTAETTISVVPLPSDEMKGRIIGREGRNIRTLEQATGVDIIIDDTPEAVTISGFDMMRREIARIALEQLIADGRIHPGRIEEVVEKAKAEIEKKIKEEGERAALELGIHGMHPELIKLVGRLRYRTSFGQNGLNHSIEVAKLMGIMAHQIGVDVKTAKRAGLLHDIGKVVSSDVEEGTHAIVGARLARKYGESEDVAYAVESHHGEVEMNTVYGILVSAADAISASRPGARAESMETYVKRLENLEKISNSFKGVEKSYALQAGREIRVVVMPEKVNDDEAVVMARDIRKKIEEEMEYPGHIKVMVVREIRAVEYAK